jgi:hypothetical protein
MGKELSRKEGEAAKDGLLKIKKEAKETNFASRGGRGGTK